MPPESLLDEEQQQSLLYSSDLELGETTKRIFEAFERVKPQRVVLDSLSEIRLLAQSSLRYRRQILALKHYFARHGATVLMLDDLTTEALRQDGAQRRPRRHPARGAGARITAPSGGGCASSNIAASAFAAAITTSRSSTGGVRVFPRLVSAEHEAEFKREPMPSGIAELDALLGGGVERGSSTLILGPAGTGKSLLTLSFVGRRGRARREGRALHLRRGARPAVRARARARLRPCRRCARRATSSSSRSTPPSCRPANSPSGCATASRSTACATVVIDSLNGYQAAMPEEQALILHMHELLQYLNRQGATTFLTVAQHGLVGDMKAPVDVTYLADTVILLRYFEALGRVRRAISVIKKRTGAHEDTIREYRIDERGLTLGEPLDNFQGVLRGVPMMVGADVELLGRRARMTQRLVRTRL